MNYIGQGIAFAALVCASAWLEVSGKDAGALWLMVAVWIAFGNWAPKKED